MKKIMLLVITIIISFIGISDVNAIASTFNEYDVVIESDNTVKVNNVLNHSTYISDYSYLLTYSNDVLTIKEGVHINYLQVNKSITITSNDKHVYINGIHSEVNDLDITIKNIDYNSYSSYDTSNHGTIMFNGYNYNVKNFIIVSGNLYIEDSDITINSAASMDGLILSFKNINIKESNIDIEFFIGASIDLLIEKSNINITDGGIYKGYLQTNSGKTTIKDCDVVLDYGINSMDTLSIINSTIKKGETSPVFGGIRSYDKINVNNTNININGGLWADKDISINGSDISITNTDNNMGILSSESANISIEESNVLVSNFICTDEKMNIKNSYVIVEGKDMNGQAVHSSITADELLIDNSRVLFKNESVVPPVLVNTKIELKNENEFFKDQDGNKLTISKVVVSSDNFLHNPNNVTGEPFFNQSHVSVGDEVYTLTLNGVIAEHVEIDGYYTTVFKILNGTWENGESNTIEVKTVYGEEVVYPTNMISNKGYMNGKWVKTGDNEYTYEYIKVVNPKTGVNSTIVVSILSIMCLFFIRNLYKNKSLYKGL